MRKLTSCGSHLHPGARITRRSALQVGAVGLLGLGLPQLSALRALAGTAAPAPRARSVIYVFLSGGLAQHETFDMKPEAPLEIRGEFKSIATRTPGLRICEHLRNWRNARTCGRWSGRSPMVPTTTRRGTTSC